ncbi:MAG: hypothetical protein JSU72_09380 [Deltaproteobacteria bacterium]|nr:MAG: hypothetical protein JSU72_09380 [Deltaproteobacteria bacterium]
MAEKKTKPKKLTMANTKKEMLEVYKELLKQLEERREVELKPEKELAERQRVETVKIADSLSAEGVVKGISDLRLEVGKLLAKISDKLEEEVDKFTKIQKAIEFKENELKEVYEIERSAETLAALIEAQRKKKEEYEKEITERMDEFELEIETARIEWKKEKKEHEARIKERDMEEDKRRKREKEEYSYGFKREQQIARDQLEDEKANTEKEIRHLQEQKEKELTEREKAIAEQEEELRGLREQVAGFPKETEKAVSNAVKEATDRIKMDAKNKDDLLRKEFEGERTALKTRLESIDKVAGEQNDRIAKLTEQLEQSYQKVQDIAVKAVEASGGFKSLSSIQQLIDEQMKKQTQEK